MSIDDDGFRRDEDLLRRALHAEADDVLPSLDALSNIRRRTARPPLWRRPVVLGMAAASVTAVAVITASAYVLAQPRPKRLPRHRRRKIHSWKTRTCPSTT